MRKNDKGIIVINLIIIVAMVVGAIMVYVYVFKELGKSDGNFSQKEENVVENFHKQEIEKSNLEKNVMASEIPIIETEDAQIPFSTNNKYFYNQLNENAKAIYDDVEKNYDNLKTGNYKIKLSDSVSRILNENDGQEKLNKNFQAAWNAINMDRVDLFFIDVSKVILKINTITRGNDVSYNLYIEPNDEGSYFSDGFNSIQDVEEAFARLNAIKKKVVVDAPQDTYNRILQVHDWLIDNVEYNNNQTTDDDHNIYGTLTRGLAVCEGYAESFKFFMDELNIPCILVAGTATNSVGITERHEWNYVKINNKWYAVDCTWDDPVIVGGGFVTSKQKHRYFLKGNRTMSEAHVLDNEFAYPNIESEDY